MEYFSLTSFIAITIAVVLSHGLLLFNDGLYGDSMLLNGLLKSDRVHYLLEMSNQAGRPLMGRILAATTGIENKTLFYRVLALLSMISIGQLTYMACLASALLSQPLSLAVALLTVAYTGNQMLIEFSVALMYYFFQTFFLCGIIFGFIAARAGWPDWPIWYSLSAVLLLLGFHFESQLAYFFVFPLLIVAQHVFGGGETPYATTGLLLNLAAFGALPVAAWLIKEKFTPRHGRQASYNRLHFGVKRSLELFLRVIRWGLIGAVIEPFRYTLKLTWGWTALIPATAAAWLFSNLSVLRAEPGPATSWGLIAVGLIALIFGNIAYILVRQPAGLRGWSTKNNILTALPTALLLTGALSFPLKGAALAAAIGFLVTFFSIYIEILHLYWIAIWAKHLSFLRRLERIPDARKVAVFAFRDEHPLSMTFDEHKEHYTVALICMMEWLWGDFTRLVIVQPNPKRLGYNRGEIDVALKSTTIDYVFADVDKNGPQASLVLLPGKRPLSPLETGLGYLWHRYAPGQDLRTFLDDLTELRFDPLPAPLAAPDTIPADATGARPAATD